MSYIYTETQKQWLFEHYNEYDSYRILTEDFNKEFESDRTVSAIQQYLTKRLGLYLVTDKTSEHYTEEEEQWLIGNFDNYSTYAVLTADFNRIFHRNKLKLSIMEKCTRNLHLTGMINTGQFGKGKIKTQCPIGTIRKNKNGSVYIKVKDSQYSYMSGYEEPYWLPIQKKVWQDHYGEVPDGKMVIFLDGNRENLDINNLYCIDQRISAIMAKNRWYTNSREHTITAIKWCELHYAMKDSVRR